VKIQETCDPVVKKGLKFKGNSAYTPRFKKRLANSKPFGVKLRNLIFKISNIKGELTK
jgi:hypothetical protein